MYFGGFDRWTNWTSAPKVWLLGGADYPWEPTADTIADVAAHEITVAGYSRQPLAAPVVANEYDEDYGYQTRLFGCHRPEWAGLDGGAAVRALVLALDSGDDATSGLIYAWGLNESTDSGELAMRFDNWHYNEPLPGGDAETRMVNYHEART
jgi:hypothetical protein